MKIRAKQIRRTETQIRAILSLQAQSGSTVTDFCKAHNIHKANFYNWRNRYSLQQEEHSAFIPIELNSKNSDAQLFAELELDSRGIVRLFQRVDAPFLKTLLKK